MKIRILFVLIALSLAFWSCEEPKPYDNTSFIYNPFLLQQDTLHIVEAISSGSRAIEWGNHLRAWVGDTKYYKSGFSMDFKFADSSLDISAADSVQLHFRHQLSFPENGADTLSASTGQFEFYEVNETVDINSGNIGASLGSVALNVKGGNDSWAYTLPDSTIMAGDTTISLGIFPGETGIMSSVYGGGSTIRPALVFYFHEPDSAGMDSVTSLSFSTDSLTMYLIKKPSGFDPQFLYLSQLTHDSLIFTINLSELQVAHDTLIHVIASKLLSAINDSASSLYAQTSTDTLQQYSLTVTDMESKISANLIYSSGDIYQSNEINAIIQKALDEDRISVNLMLKSNHLGFDPGLIALSQDPSESTVFVKSSLAVRP